MQGKHARLLRHLIKVSGQHDDAFRLQMLATRLQQRPHLIFGKAFHKSQQRNPVVLAVRKPFEYIPLYAMHPRRRRVATKHDIDHDCVCPVRVQCPCKLTVTSTNVQPSLLPHWQDLPYKPVHECFGSTGQNLLLNQPWNALRSLSVEQFRQGMPTLIHAHSGMLPPGRSSRPIPLLGVALPHPSPPLQNAQQRP